MTDQAAQVLRLTAIAGSPVEGFALGECDELFGDSIERSASWRGDRELKSLVGRRVRFVLKDAHLYSLRFGR